MAKTKSKAPTYTLPELRSSYLIQRLERPHKLPAGHALAALDNVFSFGGGLMNGGLRKEAMDLFREIFRFDYMGSAEFEWGAVPEAFQKIAKAAEAELLTAFSFEIAHQDIEKPPGKRGARQENGKATVYVMCPQPWTAEVMRRIRYYAKNPYGGSDPEMRLKEITMLNHALLPVDEWDTRRGGWLELDNGYMFFTDEEMWAKTCDLFGVER